MRLSEDEAKILIEMILDDLESIEKFLLLLNSFEPKSEAVKAMVELSKGFVATLALGKAANARMLIDKDENLIPNQAGMEIIERWEQIENAVVEDKADDT